MGCMDVEEKGDGGAEQKEKVQKEVDSTGTWWEGYMYGWIEILRLEGRRKSWLAKGCGEWVLGKSIDD